MKHKYLKSQFKAKDLNGARIQMNYHKDGKTYSGFGKIVAEENTDGLVAIQIRQNQKMPNEVLQTLIIPFDETLIAALHEAPQAQGKRRSARFQLQS